MPLIQPGAPDRQRVEERAEDHVDVQRAVEGRPVGLARVVLHQPHVLFVARDGQLPLPLGERDGHREPLGRAGFVGDEVVGRAKTPGATGSPPRRSCRTP